MQQSVARGETTGAVLGPSQPGCCTTRPVTRGFNPAFGRDSDYLVMASLAPFKSRTRARACDPWLVMAVMGSLMVVQWVHAVSGFGGAAAEDFFSRWMYVAIGAAAGVVLTLHGLQRRGLQWAWLVLGVGLLSKAIGDVIYSLAGNLDAVPVPSVSDGFWLAFYPCAYLSLLLLVRDRVPKTLAATRLDGVICGVTVAAAMACATLPTAFLKQCRRASLGEGDRSRLPNRRSGADGRCRERGGAVRLAR